MRIGVPGLTTTEASVQILVQTLEVLGQRVPQVSIRCVAVPYDHVLDSLIAHRVDVPWSPSVIEHPALLSYPLGAAPRAGIVPVLHPFAQTRSVKVEDFAAMPILYSPAVPPGLMSPGWLGDIRPLAEARLVPSTAQGLAALLSDVGRGHGLAVLPMVLGMHLGTRTRAVVLDGAPPVEIHAVYRRGDHGPRLKEVLGRLRVFVNEIPRDPAQPSLRA
ncbi:LysR substrate-binding domain-containing protein [Kocuria sp. CH-021]|uniref:LysR substrate-binding domain-containing protein n=1 Tax=Kocuria sp. CH-021 TaxID=3406735 RepID=UPI003C74FEBE